MRPNKGSGKGKKTTSRITCIFGVFKLKKISLYGPQNNESCHRYKLYLGFYYKCNGSIPKEKNALLEP